MNKYSFFLPILLTLLSCGAVTEEKKTETAKPNLIFILADQWRGEAVGYAGNDDIITPNLDRLAEESLVFDQAVAMIPVCAPWRASFLTGQYPLTHGVFYNDQPLSPEAVSMGKLYKEAGYQTGYIGKWHLNGRQEKDKPFSGRDMPVPQGRRQGFDYWKVAEVTHNYNKSFYFDENDEKHFWEGYDVFPQTDSAIAYIQRHREQPFLLYLSWGPPHDPYFTAPKEYRDLYDPAAITLRPNVPEEYQDSARNVISGYYAHCTAMDKALGDLMDAVEQAGISDNTIFVFTSDHGDMLMSKGALKKQRPWDESILVPLLIRYPEKLGRQQKHIKAPLSTMDLLPTFLGLSGLPVPETIEGKDYSEALLQGQEPDKEAALITLPVPFHEWNFPRGGRVYRGVRTERYTFVKDLKGPWLLYDNLEDPYQEHNLVNHSQFSQLKNHMEQLLSSELEHVNDDFLPADEYMKKWGYLYDRDDSVRNENYLERRM